MAGTENPGSWILLFTRLKVLITSVSRVFISLHLIQKHGGFGGAGLCVYVPEYPGFYLSENFCSSEWGYNLFDCKIYPHLTTGRSFWAFRWLNSTKTLEHYNITQVIFVFKKDRNVHINQNNVSKEWTWSPDICRVVSVVVVDGSRLGGGVRYI